MVAKYLFARVKSVHTKNNNYKDSYIMVLSYNYINVLAAICLLAKELLGSSGWLLTGG